MSTLTFSEGSGQQIRHYRIWTSARRARRAEARLSAEQSYRR